MAQVPVEPDRVAASHCCGSNMEREPGSVLTTGSPAEVDGEKWSVAGFLLSRVQFIFLDDQQLVLTDLVAAAAFFRLNRFTCHLVYKLLPMAIARAAVHAMEGEPLRCGDGGIQ
jgi:hypothetical protein